jgi:hypothetical protein
MKLEYQRQKTAIPYAFGHIKYKEKLLNNLWVSEKNHKGK